LLFVAHSSESNTQLITRARNPTFLEKKFLKVFFMFFMFFFSF